MKIGLRIKIQDPDDPTQIVNAQFASIRSNPKLGDMLRDIAKLEVEESVKLKILQQVGDKFNADPAPGGDSSSLERARMEADEATQKTLDATHAFIVEGFKLAGANDERAEELASLIDLEKVTELKARCMYGAGCLDFTKAADLLK